MVSAVEFRLCNTHPEASAGLGSYVPDIKALVVKMMDTAMEKEAKTSIKSICHAIARSDDHSLPHSLVLLFSEIVMPRYRARI